MQAEPGYVEDLQGEGALQIQTSLQNIAEPRELTIELDRALQPAAMATAG